MNMDNDTSARPGTSRLKVVSFSCGKCGWTWDVDLFYDPETGVWEPKCESYLRCPDCGHEGEQIE